MELNDKQWVSIAQHLYNTQQQRKELEKIEKELSQKLQALTETDYKSLGGITYSYSLRTGAIDYSAIPILKTIDLEPYRKQSIKTWKLSIDHVSIKID